MRGVLAGVLTLIALQVLGSGRGPEQGGKLALWLASGLDKALSPDIAAVPTRKTAPPAKNGKAPVGGISLPRNPSLGSTVTT